MHSFSLLHAPPHYRIMCYLNASRIPAVPSIDPPPSFLPIVLRSPQIIECVHVFPPSLLPLMRPHAVLRCSFAKIEV